MPSHKKRVRCPFCRTVYDLKKVKVLNTQKSRLIPGDDEMIQRVTFHCTHEDCNEPRTAAIFT